MPVKNIVRGQSVSYEMHERAKNLRRDPTPAEAILWTELRTNKLNGLHFRRQQIIDGYIADFYCHEHALIIEIDGSIHNMQKDYDMERETYLNTRDFHIIRFANKEIFDNLASVLKQINAACSLNNSPFPNRKGGQGDRLGDIHD